MRRKYSDDPTRSELEMGLEREGSGNKRWKEEQREKAKRRYSDNPFTIENRNGIIKSVGEQSYEAESEGNERERQVRSVVLTRD